MPLPTTEEGNVCYSSHFSGLILPFDVHGLRLWDCLFLICSQLAPTFC